MSPPLLTVYHAVFECVGYPFDHDHELLLISYRSNTIKSIPGQKCARTGTNSYSPRDTTRRHRTRRRTTETATGFRERESASPRQAYTTVLIDIHGEYTLRELDRTGLPLFHPCMNNTGVRKKEYAETEVCDKYFCSSSPSAALVDRRGVCLLLAMRRKLLYAFVMGAFSTSHAFQRRYDCEHVFVCVCARVCDWCAAFAMIQ